MTIITTRIIITAESIGRGDISPLYTRYPQDKTTRAIEKLLKNIPEPELVGVQSRVN